VLEDDENGVLDVLIRWQPTIGACFKNFADLTFSSLLITCALPVCLMYSFPMSVAARKDDLALKIRFDSSIKNDTAHLRAI